MSEERLPKPRSRNYVKFITGDRLRPDWQSELSRNAKMYAAGRASLGHSLLLLGLIAFMAFDLSQTIANQLRLPMSWQWIFMGGITILYIVLNVLLKQWERRFVRRYIGKRLKTMGVRPFYCPGCDYNLEGTIADQCPECGIGLATESDETRRDPGIFQADV